MQQIQQPSKWIGAAIVVTALGAVALYQFRPHPVAVATSSTPAIQAVAALGRLEPRDEVIQLAANTPGSRIAELRVKLGDRVRKGQMIAVLDTYDRAFTALQQAQRTVGVAQAKLAQVEAGAKRGEITAQQATIDRLRCNCAKMLQRKMLRSRNLKLK